jgi:hypothetical protein
MRLPLLPCSAPDMMMSADCRALACEVVRCSSLDWRKVDMMVDNSIARVLAYHEDDWPGNGGETAWKKEGCGLVSQIYT